ncbi:MAG: AAA family ATPase [Chloroflexi bacterium]|nr:AAA family ATPase [Chloroflexota bacterium]
MASQVLLITGPTSAGKTTVADSWATTRREKWAHLSLDSFRLLVKSGYHDPRLGWNDEAQRQLDIARSNVASVAANFVESGISCVIDDAVFPNWEPVGIERWKRALGPVDIDLIAIIPQWGVIRERNAARDEADRIP